MGNAQVATVGDVTAGFWNPAGLALMQGNVQVAAMHNEFFAGIGKYDYGAIAARIDSNHVIGFSLIRFGVDDIPNTIDLIDASGNIMYDKITSFSVADYAFIFSYAVRSKVPGLRYGANAKIIHRIAGDFATAWGFGLDAGAQYERGNWIFGLMGKDITSTFNAWTYSLTDDMKGVFAATGNEIPTNSTEVTLPKAILGVAYKANVSKKFSILPELNLDATFDGQRNVLISNNPVSIDPHLGIEFGYDNFIFLRAGVNNIQQVHDFDLGTSTIFQPNMGIGLRLKNLSIDYALTNIGSQESLYSNVFSLKLDIYKHK